MVIQTYARESEIYPQSFKDLLGSKEVGIQDRIDSLDELRKKRRVEKILEEKRRLEKIRRDNLPLSSRNRISATNTEKFIGLLSNVTNIEELLKEKPLNFRREVVRLVMSSGGDLGNSLRELWVDIYVGDGRSGVMNAREEAKQNDWPKNKRQPFVKDRNFWISWFLRKSCIFVVNKSDVTPEAL